MKRWLFILSSVGLMLGGCVVSNQSSSNATSPASAPEKSLDNLKTQINSLEKKCLVGSKNSCEKLMEYLEGEKIVPFAKKGCELGGVLSCFKLYNSDEGNKTIDFQKKLKTMAKKECENGNMKGCYVIGKLLEDESYKIENDNGFASYLKKGCQNGEGNSCCALSHLYFQGHPAVGEDETKSREMAEKCCQLGVGEGCYLVATGSSLPISKELELLKKGCQLGSSVSCSYLGNLYLKGKEVKKDIRRAKQYYTIGCFLGDYFSCEDLKRIKEKNP